jgi:hypothetical protein
MSLDKICEEDKEIDTGTLHFYSEGPSTQYKQKANFFLLSQEVERRDTSGGTWNFYESGHGKGIPDGVGGSLKRSPSLEMRYAHIPAGPCSNASDTAQKVFKLSTV